MKRTMLSLLLLFLFAVSATAMIRGHKWGETPAQTKAIEAKLGSKLLTEQNDDNGHFHLVYNGKIGTIDVKLIFYYTAINQLIQISISTEEHEVREKLVSVLEKKYSLNENTKITDNSTIRYDHYKSSVPDNISLDTVNRLGKININRHGGTEHVSTATQTYFSYSDYPPYVISYISKIHFDTFYKQLEDYAAKETARLKAQRRVEDDM